MSVNSIISDVTSVMTAEPPKAPEVKQTDWEKIANSKQYPEVNAYLEGRKDYFRRYLPDGRPVENISTEERIAYWNTATVIIKEIEGIQAALLLSKKK